MILICLHCIIIIIIIDQSISSHSLSMYIRPATCIGIPCRCAPTGCDSQSDSQPRGVGYVLHQPQVAVQYLQSRRVFPDWVLFRYPLPTLNRHGHHHGHYRRDFPSLQSSLPRCSGSSYRYHVCIAVALLDLQVFESHCIKCILQQK
jgi:hypothetical protein